MMGNTTEVCVGGHITLLFSIDTSARLPRNQGSRGAGFTIDHGVNLKAQLFKHHDRSLPEKMNGIVPDARQKTGRPEESEISIVDRRGAHIEQKSLYEDMIEACRHARLLREDESLHVEIALDCPRSQGFGMSASGLMALGQAIEALTGRGVASQYLKIAHRIERQHGSGLGDVLGCSVGGVELRIQPGAPSWPGHAVSFDAPTPVLLIWEESEARHTSIYIDDEQWQASITKAGDACVEVLAQKPWSVKQWPELLKQSRLFAEASGLFEEPVRALVYQTVMDSMLELNVQGTLAARLCMLGNSVVVLPRRLDEPLDSESLKQLADVIEARGLHVLMSSISPTVNPIQGAPNQLDSHRA
jgi:pantoate kinase